MKIYIRIHDDDGIITWWNHTNYESYFMDGKDLISNEDYFRGTPCTTFKQLKHEAKEAKLLAYHNAFINPKVTYWRFVNGEFVQTKFTRDGKIKK